MQRRPTVAPSPDPAHWKRVRRLLESALDLSAPERGPYLDEACGDDASLREEVGSLLAHADDPDFLADDDVPREVAQVLELEETTRLEGRRLGPWQIEDRLAVGGMGSVYRASRADGAFQKEVAVKVVRRGVATSGVLRRFRSETQILAEIDDPAIARLLDAGLTDDGLPYLVMELVAGEPIDRHCERRSLELAGRLRLFARVCEAVQIAHRRGIVHRDLKPGNVLVTSDGEPRLLDFGIAKLLETGLLGQSVEKTARGQRLMTPSFASPEQARGDPVSPASDVYSLGVMLYELVADRPPYVVDETSPEAVARLLRDAVVEPPSARRGSRAPAAPDAAWRQVDAVVMRALAKQPEERFATAGELGEAAEAAAEKAEEAAGASGPGAGEAAGVQLERESTGTAGAPAAQGGAPAAGEAAAADPGGADAPARTDVPTRPAPRGERPTDAPDLALPETWGGLEIVRKIGEGAFGEVLEARDPSLDRPVALKLFHDRGDEAGGFSVAGRARILREGQLLARVRHEHVVDVYGAAEHEGVVGLWMEYIEGRSLHDLLEAQGPFSAREASIIGVELCSALAAVHRQGVVHRDIKAQNVLREHGGRIVLMDFGAGVDLAGPAARDRGAVGTPLYMAPEVLRGEPATARSDLYSLGVLLCHLVTGTFPCTAESFRELVEKHERQEPVLLRDLRADLPPRFAAAVEKALSPDPAGRFGSAAEMERALSEATGLTVAAESAPGREKEDAREGRRVRRILWALSAFGTTLGMLGLLTFVGFFGTLVRRVALGIPSSFGEETPVDYLVWGVRSSIPGLYYMRWPAVYLAVAAVIAVAGARLVERTEARRGPVAWLRRTTRTVKGAFESVDPRVRVALILGFGVVGLVLVSRPYAPLFDAVIALESPEAARAADLSVLHEDATPLHHAYTITYSRFILAMLVGAALAFAGRGTDESDRLVRWMRAGIVITIVAAFLLMTMTWRLLWTTNFEPVLYESQKAFIVAESGDRFWLYSAVDHERWPVEADDPALERPAPGSVEYIFGQSDRD